MAVLDPHYIVQSDLESYFVDKDTGLPLANGLIYFYRDIADNVPKPVYQLIGNPGSYSFVPLPNPVTLSAVGTVQNDSGANVVIYWYPYDPTGTIVDYYYVVVQDSGGTEQFTRRPWPEIPAAIAPPSPGQLVPNFENQIANPTFNNVFINEGITTTYTVTAATDQVFEFAPDWNFVISGTGTVVIQRIAITGSINAPTSPPYVLDVNVSSGITSCFLRQRFSTNSGLWNSTPGEAIYLTGSFVAENQNAGMQTLEMFYKPSGVAPPILIVSAAFGAPYSLLKGVTAAVLPFSVDPNIGNAGFVDIYMSFPVVSHTRVSNIFVVPTFDNDLNLLPPDLNSTNRNEAFQGDYYLPRAAAKRIDSFLIGWDFPLNPRQFGASGTITTTPAYIIDQTIAACGVTGNVNWTINTSTGALAFITGGVNDAFYILQYLTGDQVREMVTNRLSVNVLVNSAGNIITSRVYLFSAPLATVVPTLPTSLGTIAANGVFTLTAPGWRPIPRSGLDTPQFTLSNLNESDDYGFSGWEITELTQINDTDKFAIVVTFQYVVNGILVSLDSISCVPGDLPCRPAVKSFQDTLSDCRYYYEKSYDFSTVEGTITTNGSIMLSQTLELTAGPSSNLYARSFTLDFLERKRINPALRVYAPTDPIVDRILGEIWNPGNPLLASTIVPFSSFYTLIGETPDRVICQANNNTRIATTVAFNAANEGWIHYQYAADARLGII